MIQIAASAATSAAATADVLPATPTIAPLAAGTSAQLPGSNSESHANLLVPASFSAILAIQTASAADIAMTQPVPDAGLPATESMPPVSDSGGYTDGNESGKADGRTLPDVAAAAAARIAPLAKAASIAAPQRAAEGAPPEGEELLPAVVVDAAPATARPPRALRRAEVALHPELRAELPGKPRKGESETHTDQDTETVAAGSGEAAKPAVDPQTQLVAIPTAAANAGAADQPPAPQAGLPQTGELVAPQPIPPTSPLTAVVDHPERTALAAKPAETMHADVTGQPVQAANPFNPAGTVRNTETGETAAANVTVAAVATDLGDLPVVPAQVPFASADGKPRPASASASAPVPVALLQPLQPAAADTAPPLAAIALIPVATMPAMREVRRSGENSAAPAVAVPIVLAAGDVPQQVLSPAAGTPVPADAGVPQPVTPREAEALPANAADMPTDPDVQIAAAGAAPAATSAPLAPAPMISVTAALAPTIPPQPAAPAAPQSDISALIDRLVEARDAAQANQRPQSVQAAINHAEFGRISLQFAQDAQGLSVALSSEHPDFNRAAQAAAMAVAAAPAAPDARERSDGESRSNRQDAPAPQLQSQTGGDQAAPGGGNASLTQPREQPAARRMAETASSGKPAAAPRTDEPPARAGIYA